MLLSGLEGVKKKDVPCQIFTSVSQIKKILDKNEAATTAGGNGAINIYKDDDGFLRGELMRHLRTIDKKIFNSMDELKKWATKWLIEIK